MVTVAEIGINHNGDINIAKKLINIAAFAGCDYVKFQKRNPDKSVPDYQKDKKRNTPWGEIRYIDYKNKIEFGENEYKQINEYCEERHIRWFASIWDMDSAKFMKKHTTIAKIPSAKLTDYELGRYCRENFDFVILSTGMSTEKEIEEAVERYSPNVLMHTRSTYPANVKELDLRYIQWLKKKYPDIHIGYSGHEMGLTTTFAAVALGAEWIERHITLDKTMWGSDQMCSLEPIGLIKLIKGIYDIGLSMRDGFGDRILYDSEIAKKISLRGV